MIIDLIHKKFPNLKDLRAREIRVDKSVRKVFCVFSYPEAEKSLAQDIRSEVFAHIRTLVPDGFAVSVKYVEDHFSEISFRKLLDDLFKKRFPLFSDMNKNKIEVVCSERRVNAVFHVGAVVKQNIEAADLIEKLNVFFAGYTSYAVDFAVVLDETEKRVADIKEQEKLVLLAVNKELLKPARYFSVADVTKFIGKPILSQPMYISDIRKPMDVCVVCGKISAKSTKASKNNPNMQVCKFTLTDESGGSLPCVTFVKFQMTDVESIMDTTGKGEAEARTLSEKAVLANDKKMKNLNSLYDGTEIIARGKVSFNDFSERLELIVYDIGKCKIIPKGNALKVSRQAPEEYLLVSPESYEEYFQESFVKTRKKSVHADKDYIALHVNATGYNVTKDKIFAICAVKIKNDAVTEKFFTYLNPETDVSDESAAQADISNGRLVFYPTLTEIIPDLYKFTQGADFIGKNEIAQIVEILNYYAQPAGFKFETVTHGQVEFLSSLYDSSVFERKPNCLKLADVARSCKVSCPSLTFCGATAETLARCVSVLLRNQR